MRVITNFPLKSKQFRSYARKLGDDVMKDGMFGALEIVGTTEGGLLCMQAWNYQGMTFLPDINFYEFIPLEEHLKTKEDPSYTPKTLLMDEF